MPGENFSRRVARAAAVGGRSYRGQTPVGWYVTLLMICVIGVGLVTYSRYERLHPTASSSKKAASTASVPPTKANLWEVGIDADICGTVKQLPATASDQALSTNGGGVMTIEPGLAADAAQFSGKNATLGAFLAEDGVVLSSSSLQIPAATTTTTTTTSPSKGSTTTTTSKKSSTSSSTTTTTTVPPLVYQNGRSCAGKKGLLQVEVWSSPSAKKGSVTKNPTALRLKDGQLITIALVPKGTPIPKPSSASVIRTFLLSNPAGVAPSNVSPATTVPSSSATTTTTPAAKSSSTTSSSSGATTTTTSKKS